MLAIQHANKICDWQENLINDEMPPEWMWPFSEELEEWFEEVDRKRKEKFGGGSDDTSSDNGAMLRNELAEGRR